MRLVEISKDEFHQRLVNPMRTKLIKQMEQFKKEVEDDWDYTVTFKETVLGGDDCFILKAEPNTDKADQHHQAVLTAYYALFVVSHFETDNGYTFIQSDSPHKLRWHMFY